MSETELAWAAGFFDGEGCTSLSKSGNKYYPRMAINQVHLEPLARFNSAIGNLANINGPYDRRGKKHGEFHRNTQYELKIYSYNKVKKTLDLLWPYFSSIKKKQAELVLERYYKQ